MHGKRDDCVRPEFCGSAHCHVGAHCSVCRDKEGGRRWRRLIAQRFKVDGVEWPCPHGKPWGYQPPERTRRPVPHGEKGPLGLPYVVPARGSSRTCARERRAICDACEVPAMECEVRYKRELQAAGGKTCWFNRLIRRASSCCPAEPPKWLAVNELNRGSLPLGQQQATGSDGPQSRSTPMTISPVLLRSM